MDNQEKARKEAEAEDEAKYGIDVAPLWAEQEAPFWAEHSRLEALGRSMNKPEDKESTAQKAFNEATATAWKDFAEAIAPAKKP